MLWHGMRLTASLPVTPSLLMIVRILPNTFEPKSVIRVQSDFVLPACRLAVAFVEGVAGYVETLAGRKHLESLKSNKNIFLAV